jgi:stage V sporulation protein D (sporulation-specific penicillin-binding protein)
MSINPKEYSSLNSRITLVKVVLTILVLVLFARCAYLFVVQAPDLRAQVDNQQTSGVEMLLPRRGKILDCNGRVLAQSVEACRIDIRPKAIPADRQEEVARIIGEVTYTSSANLLETIRTTDSPFPFLRQTEVAVGERIRAANLPGVDVFPAEKRSYPYGSLAPQVLGFVHPDYGVSQREELFGLEGLELAYEDQLHGKAGKAIYLLGPTGERLPVNPVDFTPAENGDDLVLTINGDIQYATEAALEKAVQESQSPTASAIVLDAKTGEILAMASSPTFNSNNWSGATQEQFRNNATQFAYEPGSVFKFIVGAAALEENVITPSTIITDDGPYVVGDSSFSCLSIFGGPHGAQDLYHLFQNSCNVGFIQVGQRLGEDRFRQYADLFGIGRPSSFELPQAQGYLPPIDDWYDVMLATASFGYGFYTTPLQIAGAFQAVANDGSYIPPHLVREIRNAEGQIVYRTPDQPTRQVISQATAIQLREALKGVVEGKVPESLKAYGVIGKTGTAVVYENGEATSWNNTTFVGAFPADNPQIVIMVNINRPQVEKAYAVRVCVPVFMDIATKTVDILRLPPP